MHGKSQTERSGSKEKTRKRKEEENRVSEGVVHQLCNHLGERKLNLCVLQHLTTMWRILHNVIDCN